MSHLLKFAKLKIGIIKAYSSEQPETKNLLLGPVRASAAERGGLASDAWEYGPQPWGVTSWNRRKCTDPLMASLETQIFPTTGPSCRSPTQFWPADTKTFCTRCLQIWNQSGFSGFPVSRCIWLKVFTLVERRTLSHLSDCGIFTRTVNQTFPKCGPRLVGGDEK